MVASEGRPAVNPVIVALVSVFPFLEKVPDIAAAETVVMWLDWKYALGQELTWTGFHYSDLCNYASGQSEFDGHPGVARRARDPSREEVRRPGNYEWLPPVTLDFSQ